MMHQRYYYKIFVGNKYAKDAYLYAHDHEIQIGCVVEVEYGKQRIYGVCVEVGEAIENASKKRIVIKNILQVFEYVVPPYLLEYIKMCAQYNLVSIGSIIEMMLPACAFQFPKLHMVYNKDGQHVSLLQLMKNGMRRPTIEKLLAAENCVGKFDAFNMQFSHDQEKSIHDIKRLSPRQVCLLQGATGSGKTLVALKGAYENVMCADLDSSSLAGSSLDRQDEVNQGVLKPSFDGKILIITPEVSLGKNWGNIIQKHFNHHACFYHYQVSDLYKSSVFAWANSNESGFIIGARSALFLPYKNLKMIIIDEEHSQCLKQERYPRYHARDMAILRANYENIPCVLLSATPSLETQYNVELKKYQFTQLSRTPEHGHAEFQFVKQESGQILAHTIIEQMNQAFDNGNQVLLFLNRKGYAPYCICNNCNNLLQCAGCDVPKVFYSNHALVCHKCGSSQKLPTICPSCKQHTTWKFHGIGIEKLLEFAQQMFPEHKFQAVTSQTKEIDEYIEDLNNKKIDCLIATQVLAQGHDFKNISLVVIVDADMGINSPDFRASERMFQLWQQIRGRSARHSCSGKLIVQGVNQDSKFIKLFESVDPNEKLLDERRAGNWPPFTRCAFIIIKSKNYSQAQAYFQLEIFEKWRGKSGADGIEFYGPLYMGKEDYTHEWRFLIKVDRSKRIDLLMQKIIAQLPDMKQIAIEFEVDPYTFT